MDEKTKFLVLFGDNFRRIRMLKNYSQQALADELNISKSTIQRIENGKLNPSIWALKKIAEGMNVSIDLLVKED